MNNPQRLTRWDEPDRSGARQCRLVPNNYARCQLLEKSPSICEECSLRGKGAMLNAACPLGCVIRQLASFEDAEITLERAIELAEANKSERVIVLPCKVGDTIYRVDMDPEITSLYVENYTVYSIELHEDGEIYLRYDAYDGVICTADNLVNKTPFLDYYYCFTSYEEAASMLAKKGASNA